MERSQFTLQPFFRFSYVTSSSLNSFSNLFVTSPTSQLILQPFCHFTYITTHSPTLPSLTYVTAHSPTLLLHHLCHSSFSNPSFTSPKSQALHLIHLASHPCSSVTNLSLFLSFQDSESWRKKSRDICDWGGMCVSIAELVDDQAGKLDICDSNPNLDTTFSLNIYHLYECLFTKASILLILLLNKMSKFYMHSTSLLKWNWPHKLIHYSKAVSPTSALIQL